MTDINYLETLPLYTIARYTVGPLQNGVAFVGYLRQHPSDKAKLILINDPLGATPRVMEFKVEDLLGAEEVHSAVTLGGDTAPLVKLWVKKGAHGVLLEPFEVDEPIRFINKTPMDEPFRSGPGTTNPAKSAVLPGPEGEGLV